MPLEQSHDERVPVFDAVVLAGGLGSRIGGADKPGLAVGGRAMVASVVSALTGAGAGKVTVVGPDRPELRAVMPVPPRGMVVVREDPPGAGPAPALARGLVETHAGVVAVFAADLPFLRAGHVRRLLAAVQDARTGAIMVDEGGREQWLAGCWLTGELREAVRAYTGRSLRGLLGPLAPAQVRWELTAGQPPPWLDCDTAEDLAAARRWTDQAPAGE